jgi:hypothetical protein
MATWFTLCAAVGGTLLVVQFVLTLTGLGGDHDLDGDVPDNPDDVLVDHHGSAAFFKLLSFRTLVAGITFFGLAGRAAQESQFDPATTLLAALAAGFLAMWGVQWLMRQIARLRADGTVRIADTVGRTGVVSLTVPDTAGGIGKVNVMLGDRTLELTAQSAHGPLPTGTPVRVTRRLGSELVEVAAEDAQG